MSLSVVTSILSGIISLYKAFLRNARDDELIEVASKRSENKMLLRMMHDERISRELQGRPVTDKEADRWHKIWSE
jgi:hypothetical protein